MPLTLECFCGTDVGTCEIDTLTLFLTITESFSGTPAIGASHTLSILANPGDGGAPSIVLVNPTPGDYTYDLPVVDWAPLWGTLTVELTTEASTTQVPSPAFSAYDLYTTKYHILQHYACENPDTVQTSTWDVTSYATQPQDPTTCEPGPGDLRVLCYAGGVSSIFYKSTPLADCLGCTITDTNFQPAVDTVPKIDLAISSGVCLCASGGSGDYTFSVLSGNLPCGMTLDPSTGCIGGASDGTCPSSSTITFQVLDNGGGGAAGGTATVTCSFMGGGCAALEGAGNQAY